MGCRRYFAADKIEALVDEGDSLDLLHEFANTEVFGLFVSQLHVAIETL